MAALAMCSSVVTVIPPGDAITDQDPP